MIKKEKGFTLIELLVVVAIIAILSGIAFVSIQGARTRAFDTQIRSELSQVRSNAELYYYEEGDGSYLGYETSDGWLLLRDKLPGCSRARLAEEMSIIDAGDQTYQIAIDDSTASPQKYMAWAPLCANKLFMCVDSTGSAETIDEARRGVAITEFRCLVDPTTTP